MGVKCQLTIVTVDSDVVGVLCKMPYIFTNAECADVVYVYGCCSGNATADIKEYR